MHRNKLQLWRLLFATATSLACICSLPAQSQEIKTSWARLGQGVPGVLYEPVAAGEKSHIAIFVMHSGADYTTHSACTELSKRGYRVLCANNSDSHNGTVDDGSMDRIILDAKLGVAYLRKLPGVKKIVLLGHSGGGAVMSSYQLVAENGVKACQGPEKILKCSDQLADLPPADGIMLIDSNWGLSAMTLFSIDPAIVSESDGIKRDPALDLYNPKNGFNSAGSDYSAAFIHKFQTAVGKRNTELIKAALDREAAIEAGKGHYIDDEPFTIPGSNFKSNVFFTQDVHLMSHTRKEWPLLRPNGTVVTQIIPTVRVPEGTAPSSPSFEVGAMKTTVRHFLTTYAIRTTDDFGYDEDSVHGVDWTSSYSAPPGNVQSITVPMLVMGMTGHWEYLAAETIFENAASKDKSIAFVEGAQHGYNTCTKCEKYPGQFGDTTQTTYNYVDNWLSKKGRFLDEGPP